MATHRATSCATAARVARAAPRCRRASGAGRRRCPRPRARRRPAGQRAVASSGCFVTGTGTEVGKTVVAAAIVAALDRGGARRRRRSSRRHRARRAEPGRPPDHELLRRGDRQRRSPTDEIAPYRYGPPVSPHLAAELAGERDRARSAASRRRGAAADGADVARLRGRRRAARPAHRRLPGPRPRPSTSAAARHRRPPGPRDDQPHAADDRGGAGRRARGPRRSC